MRTRLRRRRVTQGDHHGHGCEFGDDARRRRPRFRDHNLEIAAQLPVGSIITRSLDNFFLRGALLS
jgi:hypothetical protein